MSDQQLSSNAIDSIAAAQPDPERDPRRLATPCRVLIAEDNADALEMMHLMLTLLGHSVAADGVAAVEMARTFAPQIVFLDIGMPRMNGYEAARRIRELLGRRVVLVALTGWGQDHDKRRSRLAGFDHHLTKPTDPDVLEQLIAACAETTSPGGLEAGR